MDVDNPHLNPQPRDVMDVGNRLNPQGKDNNDHENLMHIINWVLARRTER